MSVIALGALAVAGGIRTAGAAGDAEKTVLISKSEARDQVAAFAELSASTLSASDPIDGAFDRFYRVTGPNLSATVDVHDGSITTLVLGGIVVPNGDVRTTEDDAQAIARDYLDAHDVLHDGMAQRVEVLDHGESVEYLISWERIEDGVIVPDIRQVGIDASSGRVFRYHNMYRPYDPPGKPSVDEASAVSDAKDTIYLGEKATVQKVELRVQFDPAGVQYLVWQIYLDGPIPEQPKDQNFVAHYIVQVDAMTGKAQIVGQG